MAGSIHRREAEDLQAVTAVRRAPKLQESAGAPSGFAQLLSAVEIDVAAKQGSDQKLANNVLDRSGNSDSNEDGRDVEGRDSAEADRANEDSGERREFTEVSDDGAELTLPVALDGEEAAGTDGELPDALDGEGAGDAQLGAEEAVELPTMPVAASPIDVQVMRAALQKESGLQGDARGTQGPDLPVGDDAGSFTGLEAEVSPDAAPEADVQEPGAGASTDTAVEVGENAESADLLEMPAADAVEAEVSAKPAAKADVNLEADLQAESIETTEQLLGLDGADDAGVQADGGEIAIPASQAGRATVTGVAAAQAGAVIAVSGGESAGQGGNTGQQGTQSGNQAGVDAASRAASRNIANAQRPQFSKLMQDRQVEVVRQIAKQIGLRSAATADQRITLLLKPESLGAVRLNMQFEEDGSLSLDARVEESAARRLIASGVEELRTALKNEGVNLNRLTVTEQVNVSQGGAGSAGLGDAGGGSQTQSGSARGRNRNGASAQPAGAAAGAARNEQTSGERTGESRLRLGDVDLKA